MPGKNSRKQYIAGGYYHIYNRGVDKRKIFQDEKDYAVFLRFLKEYLLPPDHPDLVALHEINTRRFPINCSDDIDLLAYCLMPNHFHLFVRQKTPEGLKSFMKALATNYVMYFNHKYKREGPLFQGRYKGVLVENDSYLLHITRYIHSNPKELLTRARPLQEYQYSSYGNYLGLKRSDWVKPDEILELFGEQKKEMGSSYKEFIEEKNEDALLFEDSDVWVNMFLEEPPE